MMRGGNQPRELFRSSSGQGTVGAWGPTWKIGHGNCSKNGPWFNAQLVQQVRSRRFEAAGNLVGSLQVSKFEASFSILSVIHYTYIPGVSELFGWTARRCWTCPENILNIFSKAQASMSAFDRMKRLVGLEGSSGRPSSSSSVTSATSSEGSRAVKMTNPIGNGVNSSEQRQLNEGPPLPLDLSLTTFDSGSNQSEDREHFDRPVHPLQPISSNQPLYEPLFDDLPATGHDADRLSLIDACAATIEGAESSSSSKAPFTRGHRRRSTHVTRRDLEKFQKEVLGVENRAPWYDEENGSSRPINPNDPQLEELNRAFALADMSMNSGAGGIAGGNNPGPGMYSNYTENSPTPNMGGMPRQPPSPAYPQPAPQVNGGAPGAGGMGAAINASMTMNAGHQMDLHHLYEMVLELSEVLKNNREITKNIVSSAEEVMVCSDQDH